MARFFNLREAEAVLGEVKDELRHAATLASELGAVAAELSEITQRVAMSGGAVVDREQVGRIKARRDALAGRLQEIVLSIQEHGCLIKDLNVGLLDFPTIYRGHEVYLCWKLGEDGIQFWHEVEDGFRGRKPIDREFLENHVGDPPN